MTQWYSFMLPVVRLKVSHIWRNAWIIYRCYRDAGLKSRSRSEGSEDEDIQNIARINCSVFELFYTCKVQWKEVSKHKVKEPPNKPWYIFAEVRTYLNYFIVTTTRGTFKTVLKGQTNLRLQTTYCRTLHGSDTNLKRYLRPCKRFETGLMLFDTEVHKIVIIQTGRYKGSFLGIHRAQSIIELNRTRSVGWIRLSPAIKQNRRPNFLQSTRFCSSEYGNKLSRTLSNGLHLMAIFFAWTKVMLCALIACLVIVSKLWYKPTYKARLLKTSFHHPFVYCLLNRRYWHWTLITVINKTNLKHLKSPCSVYILCD